MLPYSVLKQLQAEELIPAPEPLETALTRYAALLREWNRVVSVVSEGDLARLADRHFADSLSLAALVRQEAGEAGHLLDIGSGGGFPAIPVKLVLPALRVTLVERSEKKLGFLRKLAAALGLKHITFVHGEFPRAYRGSVPHVFTARAVEKPERLYPGLKPLLAAGSVFLCQSEAEAGLLEETFSVHPVADWWSAQGYRRGRLYRIEV